MLAATFLVASSPWATAGAAASDAELAREWQRLRATPGHFQGAPWNPEVDRWDGAKHRVMRELAARLVARQADAAQTRALLGAPDATVTGDAAVRETLRQPLESACPGGPAPRAGDTLWLYAWRGHRDRLVLVLRSGRVAGCGWLHDFE